MLESSGAEQLQRLKELGGIDSDATANALQFALQHPERLSVSVQITHSQGLRFCVDLRGRRAGGDLQLMKDGLNSGRVLVTDDPDANHYYVSLVTTFGPAPVTPGK